MTTKDEQTREKGRVSWWERAGGHVEATRTTKKRGEMKNLIKPAGDRSRAQEGGSGGDRALEGLSGAEHLQKPLRSVCMRRDTLFLLPGLAWAYAAKLGSGFVSVQWGAVSS